MSLIESNGSHGKIWPKSRQSCSKWSGLVAAEKANEARVVKINHEIIKNLEEMDYLRQESPS
jgi:hypothetical protein